MDENQSGESTVFQSVYDPAELFRLRTKNDLRRDALVVGLPMVLLMLCMIYAQRVIVFVAQSLGFRDIATVIGTSPGKEITNVAVSSLCFILFFAVFCRLSGEKVGRVAAFGKPKPQVTAPLLCIGIGVCTFANLATAHAERFFYWIPFEYHWSYGETEKGGFFAVALALVSSAVIPALVEEFACRGVLYGMLEKYGQGFAVVTTAVLFGMMHGNFSQIPFAMTVGFALGFLRAKSGSVWPAVVVHFINNAVSESLSALAHGTSDAVAQTVQLVYFSVSLLLTAVGIAWLEKRDQNAWKLEPFSEDISFWQRCGWFFSAPMIIIFLLVALGEALYFFL